MKAMKFSWKSAFLPGAALFGIALAFHRPAEAVPAFAEQTGRNCAACHVGGFGPELTQFGREFKLGGYTLRMHKSVPLSAMAIASWTHTQKDQVPPPEHLNRNDNLVLDQASLFVAGGIGEHFGGFAQLVTYDGVGRAWSWDNIDLRAVTNAKVFGQDAIIGLTLNNNPTAQDPWNTLPAWGFPFTDTAVSETPGAGELIDDPLGGNTLGLSAYGWFDHKVYVEAGAYSSPSRGFLNFVGMDPKDPGSLHGIAPYGRIAYQADLAGGTFEIGANVLHAAIFPERDRSSGFTDHYTDWGLDSSWLRSVGKSDSLSANVRFEHENGDLRASCALALVGDGTDPACARYHLNEWRAAVRYTWHGKVGLTVSPFSISGSRNFNLYEGNGRPDSNGVLGQIDFTPWGGGNSPLGPRFNARFGVQYTLYGKFNGSRHDYDFAGANAHDNNALRLFTWIAF
ncbi:hypothetical protein GCM10022276_11380 [Sphingomonas limnosediminicola]|uniref:Cytochrome C n=1 Tax=Sphingomonas limnosediminicola TaxID=940133 RepID=A0ABP7L4A7_9SPHN